MGASGVTTKSFARLVPRKTSNLTETMLDCGVSVVILLYTLVLFIESQFQGKLAAQDLGLPGRSDYNHASAQGVFQGLEHSFNALFVLELSIRLSMQGKKFFRDSLGVFDFGVVVATCIDAWILQPMDFDRSQSLGIARLVRVLRLARFLRVIRIIRLARHLSQLRVLVNSLTTCMSPLFWSLMILSVIIVGSGIFVAQVVADFILDDDNDFDVRCWIFDNFGDAAKSSYTMFEITFSGSWPATARPLVENVSPFFAVFWIAYIVVITFAVMRIIGAIFLSETIRAANNDSEMMVMSKIKERDSVAQRLRDFFVAADTSGDGLLSLPELQVMLDEPEVAAWLSVMELDDIEVLGLYELLDDDGDGAVNCDEFVGGALRLKGNARAIDSILIMHEQAKLAKRLDEMSASVGRFGATLQCCASTRQLGGAVAREVT